MKCRSVAESLLQTPPSSSQSFDATDATTIALSAAAFNTLALQTREREAKLRAKLLNYKGTSYDFKVGDKVSFYLPPSENKAKSLGRKPKHVNNWVGPATLTKQLSSSETTFGLTYKGRYFERTLINLRPNKSDGNHTLDIDMADQDINVGDYIAVCDTRDDPIYRDHFHIGRVYLINEDKHEYHVHYHGATSSNIKSAKWRPYYDWQGVGPQMPKRIDRDSHRFTGICEKSLVLATNLELTNNSILTASSRKTINTLKLHHHIAGKTWLR